jgi:hypothetical protein
MAGRRRALSCIFFQRHVFSAMAGLKKPARVGELHVFSASHFLSHGLLRKMLVLGLVYELQGWA